MTVIGKAASDVEAFVEALDGTGAFFDVNTSTIERNDDDATYRSDVVAYYLPPSQPAPSPSAAAPAAAAPGRTQP